MMENNVNINENAVELNDEQLEDVTGGKHSYITGDSGNSNIRTGPGKDYRSIGTLRKGSSVRYLHDTARDSRGVLWYKVNYNGRTGWVSSRYTVKERF